ncbi:MAG: hypothetical protein WAU69_12370 [Solirubrobacteraceae bacterium]
MLLMMRSIKLVGLTFVAVLALGAVTASSAVARALVHFTAEGATTGTGGAGIIETKKGVKIECAKGTGHGNVTGLDKIHLLLEFEECKGPSGTTCTTTEGAKEVGTSGHVHVLALALLGSDTAPPLDLPAVLVSTENKADEKANVTFECQVFGIGTEITTRGSIIGLLKNVTTGKGGVLITFAKAAGAGVQQDLHFWDESEEGVLDFLEFEAKGVESFAFEQSSVEATDLLLSTGTPPILVET